MTISSIHNLPNFWEKYFVHKELKRVRGKPNIDTIVKTLKQLKQNAQCVPTTQFGGNYGYLVLVIPRAEYLRITGQTNITVQTDPGLFNPGRTTTTTRAGSATRSPDAAELASLKAAHEEKLHQFHEYRTMKTILRNQLINSYDEKYLQPLRDSTSMINKTIPEIIKFLTTRYGKVSAEEFERRSSDIKEYLYDPQEPIDTLFDKIKEFSEMCALINKGLTEEQEVHLAYLIIS